MGDACVYEYLQNQEAKCKLLNGDYFLILSSQMILNARVRAKHQLCNVKLCCPLIAQFMERFMDNQMLFLSFYANCIIE